MAFTFEALSPPPMRYFAEVSEKFRSSLPPDGVTLITGTKSGGLRNEAAAFCAGCFFDFHGCLGSGIACFSDVLLVKISAASAVLATQCPQLSVKPGPGGVSGQTQRGGCLKVQALDCKGAGGSDAADARALQYGPDLRLKAAKEMFFNGADQRKPRAAVCCGIGSVLMSPRLQKFFEERNAA